MSPNHLSIRIRSTLVKSVSLRIVVVRISAAVAKLVIGKADIPGKPECQGNMIRRNAITDAQNTSNAESTIRSAKTIAGGVADVKESKRKSAEQAPIINPSSRVSLPRYNLSQLSPFAQRIARQLAETMAIPNAANDNILINLDRISGPLIRREKKAITNAQTK
jgi:hypothetical protein